MKAPQEPIKPEHPEKLAEEDGADQDQQARQESGEAGSPKSQEEKNAPAEDLETEQQKLEIEEIYENEKSRQQEISKFGESPGENDQTGQQERNSQNLGQESDPEPVFRFKQNTLGNEIDFKGIPKPSVERNLESPLPDSINIKSLPSPSAAPTTNPGLAALSPQDKQ